MSRILGKNISVKRTYFGEMRNKVPILKLFSISICVDEFFMVKSRGYKIANFNDLNFVTRFLTAVVVQL